MGTRNLTIVIRKGEVKMAQYGQWDGYLGGVGRDIAVALKKTDLPTLRKAFDKCVFISADKLKNYWKECGADSDWVTLEVSEQFQSRYPLLSRDYSGGKAISLILSAAKQRAPIELFSKEKFAADSLFCEWAYVVDLDKGNVEVYKGFNQEPLTKKDRFFYLQEESKKENPDDKYYPVKLLKKYKIKDFTLRAVNTLEAKLNKEAEAEEANA